MADEADPNALTPDTSGSDFSVKSYAIAPEDQVLADSIRNFDPVDDVPSPVTLTRGGFKPPEKFSSTMLPPAMRQRVEQQLSGLSGDARAARDHQLTRDALRQNAMETRIRLGAGPGANAYVREALSIALERHNTETEWFQVSEQLAEVVRWDPDGTDPNTGQQKFKPVSRVEGENRRQMEARQAALMRRIEGLDGFEGGRRLERALHEAVEQHKGIERQLRIDAKAREKAEEMLEQEEIDRLAAARASHLRHNIR